MNRPTARLSFTWQTSVGQLVTFGTQLLLIAPCNDWGSDNAVPVETEAGC